ncbi:hypothetical protein EZS27_007480 [termite gut metagenome]|uniref:Uncharacterized protein n=1 Tax=termite gut metagenome TaxID=433724 RepID=A0A5J4SFW9_9ZZZZ
MITLIPVGGLANRMHAIASALSLANDCNTHLHIIWYKDAGLNCEFHQLFQPLPYMRVTVKSASLIDFLLYDRPRRKNFWIPRAFQYVLFDKCLYDSKVVVLKDRGFDFLRWAKGKNVFLTAYSLFYPLRGFSFSGCFVPKDWIQQRIGERYNFFNKHTVGVHIRRADNVLSISQSPTELFINRMNDEIQRQPETLFYLATDSQEEKVRLRSVFGKRVITLDGEISRTTLAGIENAVVDLFLLSKTDRIIGSSHSSYTEMAAELSGIECMILRNGE